MLTGVLVAERRQHPGRHSLQLDKGTSEPSTPKTLKDAYTEIDTQRERMGILLGQLRELQAEYSEGTAQRLAEENSTLKQRIRQLTEDNRGLEQRLQTARSNNRSSINASPILKLNSWMSGSPPAERPCHLALEQFS